MAEPTGRQLAEPGWRTWRDAWGEALYGAGGFYRRPEGPRGHFETSANAGGAVTEVFAAALLRLARRHGCRQIVDVGAGRGELLQALASAPGRDGTRLVGVDVVPRPADLPREVEWLQAPGGPRLPAGLTGLRDALVIAHEWLDVVPCEVVEVDDAGLLRVVEVATDGTERLGGPATAEQLAWCARWWPPAEAAAGARPAGTTAGRAEVGLDRDAAWTDLVARVRSGVVLAVDYGHLVTDRPPTGTLAAHRDGHLVPPVPDGSCDLTADVAWDSLSAPTLTETGSRVRLTTQRAALLDLGVDAARPMPGGDPATYLLGLQRAGAAGTLLDPAGLGGLGWLLLEVATGQPDPPTARVEP